MTSLLLRSFALAVACSLALSRTSDWRSSLSRVLAGSQFGSEPQQSSSALPFVVLPRSHEVRIDDLRLAFAPLNSVQAQLQQGPNQAASAPGQGQQKNLFIHYAQSDSKRPGALPIQQAPQQPQMTFRMPQPQLYSTPQFQLQPMQQQMQGPTWQTPMPPQQGQYQPQPSASASTSSILLQVPSSQELAAQKVIEQPIVQKQYQFVTRVVPYVVNKYHQLPPIVQPQVVEQRKKIQPLPSTDAAAGAKPFQLVQAPQQQSAPSGASKAT